MSRLDAAAALLTAWQPAGLSPLPAGAAGLYDLAATGLAGLGVALPAFEEQPDGAWIALFFAALSRAAAIAAPEGAGARSRAMAQRARDQAAYHLDHAARLGNAAAAWAGGGRAQLGVSLREFTIHLALGFAMHGRVPHCGPAGRELLPGAVAHEGPQPFAPPRPPYRYAGDCSAEVQLNFGLPVFVDTLDDSVCPDIIRTGWWEPWIDGLVRNCLGRGDVAVNVGANVGYHALLMARCVEDNGRVFAFEPNPRLVALLRRSLVWGGLQAMATLLPIAASDARGNLRFEANRLAMGNGHLAGAPLDFLDRILRPRLPGFHEDDLRAIGEALAPRRDTFNVHASTLDATVGTLADCVHLLLIDAEGAEPMVLDGGRELIRRSRDIAMIVEWSNDIARGGTRDDASRARTMAWLREDGFSFWRIRGDRRDLYARPAVLEPLSAEGVLAMEGYGDIYMCRSPAA